MPNDANKLGYSIIIFTILTRLVLLPTSIKQQYSSYEMRALDPEKQKIQKKYENSTDRDSKAKMNQEIQKLYSENGINPLAGCLPLLLQLPVFIALSYVMRQMYMYIDALGVVYTDISEVVLSLPGYMDGKTNEYFIAFNNNIVQPMLSKGVSVDLLTTEGINQVISKMQPEQWTSALAAIPTEYATEISALLVQKEAIETFYGVNLSMNASFTWPTIIIPLGSAITTYLSSYLMMKNQPVQDAPGAATMQNVMLYVMPILIGLMTVGFPVGVGIYWITSSTIGVFQAYGTNKYFKTERCAIKMEERRLQKKVKLEQKRAKKEARNQMVK